MKDIEISRDKKNPTWVWVWNNEKPKQFKEEDKVILLDVFELCWLMPSTRQVFPLVNQKQPIF